MNLLDIVRERPIDEKPSAPIRCPFLTDSTSHEVKVLSTGYATLHRTEFAECSCGGGRFSRHADRGDDAEGNVWYTRRQDNRSVVLSGIPTCCASGYIYHCVKCDGPVSAVAYQLDKDEPIEKVELMPVGPLVAILGGTFQDGKYKRSYRMRYACEACGHGGYIEGDGYTQERVGRGELRKLTARWSAETPESLERDLARTVREPGPVVAENEPVVLDDITIRSFDLVPVEQLVDPHTRLMPEGYEPDPHYPVVDVAANTSIGMVTIVDPELARRVLDPGPAFSMSSRGPEPEEDEGEDPVRTRIDAEIERVTPSKTLCGKYVGDNDATCPIVSCIREKGHAGLCDNVSDLSDEDHARRQKELAAERDKA